MSNELQKDERYVTKEYLLSHGFVQYNKSSEDLPYEAPFENDEDFHFIEKEFDRNMFAIIFSQDISDSEWYHHSIYVQEDAGCGFVCIPERWSNLPIEYLESIYYGIRGEKPKFTGFTEYEIVEPKQLPQK